MNFWLGVFTLIAFCDRLLALLDSGHSLQVALMLMKTSDKRSSIRHLSSQLLEKLLSGEHFQDALVDVFNVPSLLFMKGLDLSVQPVLFLRHIRDFLDMRRHVFRTVIKSSVYPLFLIVSCCAVLSLVWFVFLPQIFQLSTPSGFLAWILVIKTRVEALGFSDLVVLVLCVGLLVWRVIGRNFGRIRSFLSVELGTFFWMLGIVCSQGLSLNQALVALSRHSLFSNRVDLLRRHLYSGGDLEAYYVSQGIEFRFNGATLGERFLSVGQREFDRAKRRVISMLALVQPVLLIIVGCVVFCMVYLLFVPMLTAFKGI